MLLLALLAAAAPSGGKASAMDDWHQLAITDVGGETEGPLYLRVQAGDLNGDGIADDAVLKLICAGNRLTSSSYVITAREAGSGMATGKRQYAPVKFVKEWGAASPQLSQVKPTYDVKTIKTARQAADGWTDLALSNADNLCGATQAAAAAIVKSKSNITNN
jgi:hypothetical protein